MSTHSCRITKFVLIFLLCTLASTSVFAQDFVENYEKGEMAIRFQKWKRAVKFLSKALADNPKLFVAYHKRALAYSKTGQYDKCIADLKKATELAPNFPEAHALMGVVYEIKKDYRAALKAYQEALKREKRIEAQRVLQKYIDDVKEQIKKKK